MDHRYLTTLSSVLALVILAPVSLAGQDATWVTPRTPRGGPRNSDSLLRWDPDQGEGVWHATEETELPC